MAEEILKASQSNLDSSRGDFSSETPKELTSLTAVQTAAKWGDESGPQAARTQYSTSICEMNTSVTQLNAEILALLGGITTTIQNFSANELESVEAVNYLSQQIEQAKLSANSASSLQVAAAISGAATAQATQALMGVLAGKRERRASARPSYDVSGSASVCYGQSVHACDESLVYFSEHSASSSDDRAPDAFFSANNTCLANVVDA